MQIYGKLTILGKILAKTGFIILILEFTPKKITWNMENGCGPIRFGKNIHLSQNKNIDLIEKNVLKSKIYATENPYFGNN